jgi:multiple antibiotic resistance protein
VYEPFLTTFATLFVAVGPLETIPAFLALTSGEDLRMRRRTAVIAATTATAVLLAFSQGGIGLLRLLGVGLPAFRTAGGILLLLVAADLLLARHSGISSLTPIEENEARHRASAAVVPLAIPLLAGPGSMTAIVLLIAKTTSPLERMLVIAGLVAVMAITLVSMLAGTRLMKVLGVTGSTAVARISGILLAALAMQFVFDGLSESGLFRPQAERS